MSTWTTEDLKNVKSLFCVPCGPDVSHKHWICVRRCKAFRQPLTMIYSSFEQSSHAHIQQHMQRWVGSNLRKYGKSETLCSDTPFGFNQARLSIGSQLGLPSVESLLKSTQASFIFHKVQNVFGTKWCKFLWFILLIFQNTVGTQNLRFYINQNWQ